MRPTTILSLAADLPLDAAIAILTGVDAGERGEDGDFPEGSVNGLVESQLIEYATARKSFAKEAMKSGED